MLYWVLVGVGAWLLLLIYGLIALADDDAYGDKYVHVIFIVVYTIIGALVTCVLAATNITSEKESRSWELLLCTPLGDWHILLAKFIGTVRRCLPIWLLPIGHIALFTLGGCCHVALLPLYLTIVASTVILLAGAGLYFGARFRRTTTAVILNISLALGLWAALPGAMALATEAMPRGDFRSELRNPTEFVVGVNPIYQAGMVSRRMSGVYNAVKPIDGIHFNWEGAGWLDLLETAAYMLLLVGINVALAALLAWRAKCQFRKRWL